MKLLFTAFTILLFSIAQAQNKAGTLDKSFGVNGKVLTSSATAYLDASAGAAATKEGNIIVGGSISSLGEADGYFALKYSADGLPDSSFGNKGQAEIRGAGYGQAIAVQPDNKVVIAGYDFTDDDGAIFFTVARFNADGSVDTSFGEGGKIKDYSGTRAYDVAIQDDGKIVVSGEVRASYVTIRYLQDGKRDNSFGSNGVVITDFNSVAVASANAIQPDGKIIVAGDDAQKLLLARYNSDGSLDQTFGAGGKVISKLSELINNATDIVLQPDDKIVVAGTASNSFDYNIQLIRYLPNGSIDSSFGTNGIIIKKLENNSQANRVALQSDGRIVIAGFTIGNTNYAQFLAERFNSDGSTDSTFGNNGYQVTAADISSTANGLIIQNDGKIVLAGGASNDKTGPAQYEIALTRYYGDGNTKQPLAIRIKRWLQHHGISWQLGNNIRYYAVQRSTDGITYKEIAKLGNSSNTYEDAAPLGKESYYRLAAIAKDGSRTYSNTVLIDETQQVRMFPNPVKDNLQLQGLATGGKTAVSVMDLQGNVRATATAGGSSYSLSTSNLTPGNYLLKLQHNGTTTTQAFIKE